MGLVTASRYYDPPVLNQSTYRKRTGHGPEGALQSNVRNAFGKPNSAAYEQLVVEMRSMRTTID